MWQLTDLSAAHNELLTVLSTALNREAIQFRFSTSDMGLSTARVGLSIASSPNTSQVSFLSAFRFFSGEVQIRINYYSMKICF